MIPLQLLLSQDAGLYLGYVKQTLQLRKALPPWLFSRISIQPALNIIFLNSKEKHHEWVLNTKADKNVKSAVPIASFPFDQQAADHLCLLCALTL